MILKEFEELYVPMTPPQPHPRLENLQEPGRAQGSTKGEARPWNVLDRRSNT